MVIMNRKNTTENKKNNPAPTTRLTTDRVHPGQHALRGWSEVGKWWHTVLTQSVASDTKVDMDGIRSVLHGSSLVRCGSWIRLAISTTPSTFAFLLSSTYGRLGQLSQS